VGPRAGLGSIGKTLPGLELRFLGRGNSKVVAVLTALPLFLKCILNVSKIVCDSWGVGTCKDIKCKLPLQTRGVSSPHRHGHMFAVLPYVLTAVTCKLRIVHM
jgi:hypothetical protein